MSDVIGSPKLFLEYDPEVLEKKGRDIYKNNENLRNLLNVMEHPEFQRFFETYFNNWEDIRVLVMFMKIYHSLGKNPGKSTDNLSDGDKLPLILTKSEKKIDELTGYQKIALLKSMIDSSEIRKKFVDDLMKWSNKNAIITDKQKKLM